MARNADLRKLLQEKLGVERAQVYKLAQDLANRLSISTSDGILLLAAKNGINLKKHGGNLSPEKLSEIRALLPHVSATAAAATPVATSSNGKRGKAKSKKGFKVKVQDAEDDPILTKATHAEMEAMVPVYKTLYTLENSIRQFITRVLVAKHGDKWWDKLATSDLKKTYAKNTRAEEPDRPRRQPGFTGDGAIQHLIGHLESHQRRTRSGPGLEHAPSGTGKEPSLRQPCVARSGDLATSSAEKSTKFWRECGDAGERGNVNDCRPC